MKSLREKDRKKNEEEIQGPKPWESPLFYEKKEDSSKEPTEKQLQSKRKTQVWCTQNPAEESNLCRRSSQVYLKLCRCQIRERKRRDHRSQHRECWRTIQGQSQWRGGDRRSVQWG